jgi:ribosomal protein L9
MATDVVPVLNEKIQTSFKSNVMKDRRIAQISKRIRDGTATLHDGHDYAERLGENLSKALSTNLTAATLPDGKLYYNIANRTITPALEENYNLTNEVAENIQKIVDAKQKIGLGTVKADFPKGRIQGLIDKMTADDITLEDALKWIKEPIINNSEAFFDDYVDANAKFREDVGLKATLTRTAEPGCCKWCDALAGTYDYGSAPDDIYRRHEFCRCTVTYQVERRSQNVWSKRSWESSTDEIDRRKAVGTESREQTAMERIEAAAQIERDKTIKNFIQETGYDRTTATRITRNKDPGEIQRQIAKIKENQNLIRRAQGK